MQKDGVDASFVYNENGLRVQKTVNGVVTNYTLHGKNIVHMTQSSDELHFFYDAQNKPAVVVYNGTAYTYVKNLQGDIVAILDNAGAVVVAYSYGTWGEPIATTGSMKDTLGDANPFRYRAYCFDREMELYYLRSRFYNPCWCRFLNADVLYRDNIYAYCYGNPVANVDPDGYVPLACYFDDMGFGNIMVSMLFGGGGSSCIPAIVEGFQIPCGEPTDTPWIDLWENIEEIAHDKEVKFVLQSDGRPGGQIQNSYKMNLWEIIQYTAYIKNRYGDAAFTGSITGFVFEWELHNIAYHAIDGLNSILNWGATVLGIDKDISVLGGLQERCMHADFGGTIYNDIEDHGWMSILFIVPYNYLFPRESIRDGFTYIFDSM